MYWSVYYPYNNIVLNLEELKLFIFDFDFLFSSVRNSENYISKKYDNNDVIVWDIYDNSYINEILSLKISH